MTQFNQAEHDKMIERGRYLQDARAEVAALLTEAFEEDDREGSRFDRQGWVGFFLEEIKSDPNAVVDAWLAYDHYRSMYDN